MNHKIKNHQDNYISGKEYEKIRLMLDEGHEECIINDRLVTLVSDYRKDGERLTYVNVEGL